MAATQSKTCRKCGQEKPASAFPFNRCVCLICTAERQRRWEAENREHVNARSRRWSAENPERSRQLKERSYRRHGDKVREKARQRYHASSEVFRKQSKDRYASDPAHRAKRLAYAKQYRIDYPDLCRVSRESSKKAKPEKYRARAYHDVLKRRARRRGLPDTWSRQQALWALAYFDHACATCRTPFGLLAKPHFDHWVPLTHRACPGTVPENMVPLCDHCNLSKNNRDAARWLRDKFGNKAERIARSVAAFFSAVKP